MGKRGKQATPWEVLFLAKVVERDGHSIWTGFRESSGRLNYSSLTAPSKSPKALAWLLQKGELPLGNLTNSCGQPDCIKPEHMRPTGSVPANMHKEIRLRWARNLKYRESFTAIGDEFGVSKQRIEQICHGVTAKDSDI